MVDFPDGGVLGQQSAIAPLDLGDVADEHRRAHRLAMHHQRQGAQQHRRAAGIHFQAHAGPAGE